MCGRENALDGFIGDGGSSTATGLSQAKDKLRMYFSELEIPRTTDPLKWWEENSGWLSHLAELAHCVLCISATAVPSGCVFSTRGIVMNRLRCSLFLENVDVLIFLPKIRMLSSPSKHVGH